MHFSNEARRTSNQEPRRCRPRDSLAGELSGGAIGTFLLRGTEDGVLSSALAYLCFFSRAATLLAACLLVAKAGAEEPFDVEWTLAITSSDYDHGWGVAVLPTGGVVIAGETYGGLVGENAGSNDAFLATYDRSGALQFRIQSGGPGADTYLAVAVDAAGDIYASGDSGFMAILDKYDAKLETIWTREIGSGESTWSNAVATSSSRNSVRRATSCGGGRPAPPVSMLPMASLSIQRERSMSLA
jgi:hypothetical protein